MPFDYYRRLTARQKRIYDRSDAITSLPLADPEALHPLVRELERALAADRRSEVNRHCAALAGEICRRFAVPPVRVRVLAARPSGDYGELHGLYDPEPEPPLITLWMRTAAKRQVVAFRSFLRTLVHELLHHLDYEHFELEETFHTEGFFKRESSLANQLLGVAPAGVPPTGTARGERPR